MLGRCGHLVSALGIALVLGNVGSSPLYAGGDALVKLQLTPATSSICSTGGTADIYLRAVSLDSIPDDMSAIAACLDWDPVYLKLLGIHDDAESPYQWVANFFPDDRTQDRVNDDRANNVFWSEQACVSDAQCSALAGCDTGVPCSNDGDCRPETFCDFSEQCGPFFCCEDNYCFYSGFPFNDGNALYEAWSQLFGNQAQALPGPSGLVVTKLTFQSLQATPPAGTQVRINAQCGPGTFTAVYSGETPTESILAGPLPSTVTVHSGSLATPTAAPLGPRYLRITPGAGTVQIALKVKGLTSGVTCVDHYVQSNGTLATTPVFKTGTQWGAQVVRDTRIRPSAQYRITADCGTSASAPVNVTTWMWGDLNNTGLVDVDDILHMLDAFSGVYFPPATFESCNLFPCEALPGGEVIDIDDILSILDAYSGVSYTAICGPVCP